MFANSRTVHSAQLAPHPRLAEIVRKHLDTPFRRVPNAGVAATLDSLIERLAAPFVLDAGCGTGASTLALTRQFPDSFVLGVDKSAARLSQGDNLFASREAAGNLQLWRCDLVDFWQLAAAMRLRCRKQFLFYPNPWPKAEHLKRRWHAHPVFPAILALGGEIELRTNWRIYAEEFAQALRIAGIETRCEEFVPPVPLTPFERKYAASGHALWRCRAALTARSDRSSA